MGGAKGRMKYLHLLENRTEMATRTEEAPAPAPATQAIVEQQRRDLESQQLAQHYERVAETHIAMPKVGRAYQSIEPDRTSAMSLIKTCKEHGVGLKLDTDGTLIVISNGAAWRSLVNAIEAHVDEIVELLMAGWDGTDT